MIQAKCIEKFRDKNNRIIAYRLEDNQGNIQDISSNDLKVAIINKQINVANIALTTDNRLIDDKLNSEKLEIEEYIESRGLHILNRLTAKNMML